MTIREAAKEWKVKEQTVLNYILEGYIYGLSIENNEIVIKLKPEELESIKRPILPI